MRRSVSEAFWALCAADSMSMPVHWYYNIDDIRRDFGGWISGFNSPRDRHPSSILTLSNTSRRTTGAGVQGRPDITTLMPGFVFQLAAVGQPGRLAPTDLMWSVTSSSMTSWTCGKRLLAPCTTTKVWIWPTPDWKKLYRKNEENIQVKKELSKAQLI